MTALRLMPTPIAGMVEAVSDPFTDARGSFARLFCRDALQGVQGARPIDQINLSTSRHRGTVRGLHFQRGAAADAKWVRCLQGAAYDVAVDLRPGSPSFGRWHAVTLDADRLNAVFLPEGLAHGFQSLTEDCTLLYLHSAPYAPQAQGGVAHDDPDLAIPWPLPVAALSARDAALPPLARVLEEQPC